MTIGYGSDSQAPLIRIRNLRFCYPGAKDDVLSIGALDIAGSGLIALTGASGAGKSTLIELMAGTLRETYAGSVEIFGVDLQDLKKDADRQRHLRRIGFIPQDYGLLPGLTVRQVLEQDLRDAQIPRQEIDGRIDSAISKVSLQDFIARETQQLSGGQRQRVAIARMLARDVELVIADEPTANLDRSLVREVVGLFRKLAASRPVVIVTHDPTLAQECDRTVLLPSAPRSPIDISTTTGRRRWWWMFAILVLAAVVAGAVVITTRPSSSPKSTAASSATKAAPQLGSNPTNSRPPSPRVFASMAYDPISQRLILFGGSTSTADAGLPQGGGLSPLGDTWAWNGKVWTQLHPKHSPPAMAGGKLVLDPVSGHLVLISGFSASDSNGFPIQTGMWSWAGSDWSRVGDNVIQELDASVAADPKTKQILIAGAGDTGSGGPPAPATYQGGSYAWDGTQWISAPDTSTDGVIASDGSGETYDPVSQHVVQFGGVSQAVWSSTSTWDGNKWTEVQSGTDNSIAVYPPGGMALAATDDSDGQAVLLAVGPTTPGASAESPSTWTWNGVTWIEHVVSEPPFLNSDSAMAYDPSVRGIVLFGGSVDSSLTSTNQMYIWQGSGWTQLH